VLFPGAHTLYVLRLRPDLGPATFASWRDLLPQHHGRRDGEWASGGYLSDMRSHY
jgi:hypothetical protein